MAEARDGGRPQKGPFSSVPLNLPSLMRAYRISERAAKSGLSLSDKETCSEGLDRALKRFKAPLKGPGLEEKEKGLGDLLLALVNWARSENVHPEVALGRSVRDFVSQCEQISEKLAEKGLEPASISDSELAAMWREAGRRPEKKTV
jgi:uncharacterized protein YabN with tetrapyrrole methylase and pyrophosphatase domain